MDHLILNNGSDGAALAEVALKALREARSSKTSSSGSIFVSDGQTDDDGIALGTGTIINGVDGGIQPWVGDTTPPGKPTGITAESHNGAIWVSWDGTLEGGIPADFDHVQFTAVDGSQTVDMGQLGAAGKVTAAELTAGDTVTITAIAYDDAHDAQGNSTPNASPISDAVTVIVQSAVDAGEVEKAQSDAQDALNQAGQAKTAAQDAQNTADGKNKIFSSATQPSSTVLVPGDLWFQLDSNKNVTGIKVWNGSVFVDYVLMANQILVAGSVGTIQLANGAVTTDQITASEALLKKLLVRNISADEIDVGGLAAAIVTSGLFQTATSGARVVMDSNGIRAYNSSNALTFQVNATNGDVSMYGKFYSGHEGSQRVIIDDNYNDIDNPSYVNIDGYVAFESPSANVSPFIGGTHGSDYHNNWTGSIITSGISDKAYPAGSSLQLRSHDSGGSSDISMCATHEKDNVNVDAAIVQSQAGVAQDGMARFSSVILAARGPSGRPEANLFVLNAGEEYSSQVNMNAEVFGVNSFDFTPTVYTNPADFLTWRSGYSNYSNRTWKYHTAGMTVLSIFVSGTFNTTGDNGTYTSCCKLFSGSYPKAGMNSSFVGSQGAVGAGYIGGPTDPVPGTVYIHMQQSCGWAGATFIFPDELT